MILPINFREIQPISIWSDGQIVQINAISADVYYGYNFIDNYGGVDYSLQLAVEQTDADGSVTTITTRYITGKVDIDKTTADQWGQDDQIIFEYIADKLNLILI